MSKNVLTCAQNKFNAGIRKQLSNVHVATLEPSCKTYHVGTGPFAPAVFLCRLVCTSVCTARSAEEHAAHSTAFYLQGKVSKSAERLFLIRIPKRSLRGALLKMAQDDLLKIT